MPEWVVAIILAIASSLFSGGVVYGILKTKLEHVKEQVDTHVRHCDADKARIDDKYVSKSEFTAVIKPIQRSLEILQQKSDEILKAVLH